MSYFADLNNYIDAVEAAAEKLGYALTWQTARAERVREIVAFHRDRVPPTAAAASLIFTQRPEDRLLVEIDGDELGGAA